MTRGTRGGPSSSTDHLAAVGRAYVNFGLGLWQSAFAIGADWARSAADAGIDIALDRESPPSLATLLRALIDRSVELATVLPIAGERLRDDLATPPMPPSSHDVGGKPMLLPARVLDAAQGWALYFVSAQKAREQLARQTDELSVLDLGNDRTPLGVFGVDYRQSDLGTYREVAAVLFVTAAEGGGRGLPGAWFLGIAVDQTFTRDAGHQIWGFPKTLAPTLSLKYDAPRATFAIAPGHPGTLGVSFPRFGSAETNAVPFYIHSVLGGRAHRTTFRRSAAGEGMQIGGNVTLELAATPHPQCLCAGKIDAPSGCLCLVLRALGLPKAPAANGWAEQLSGEFEPPRLCAPMAAPAANRSGTSPGSRS
jgi:hypothetical protein